jgi:hypothetical protein
MEREKNLKKPINFEYKEGVNGSAMRAAKKHLNKREG